MGHSNGHPPARSFPALFRHGPHRAKALDLVNSLPRDQADTLRDKLEERARNRRERRKWIVLFGPKGPARCQSRTLGRRLDIFIRLFEGLPDVEAAFPLATLRSA